MTRFPAGMVRRTAPYGRRFPEGLRRLLRRHWTIRIRLTVLYGGLLFLAGTVLLGATYLLVAQRLEKASIAVQVPEVTAWRSEDKQPTAVLTPEDELEARREKAIILAKVAQAQREFKQETLDAIVTQGGIALIGVAVVAGWLGWIVAGRALLPLSTITATARRVADRSLHERIALDGPRDELRELADTFDSMLERLDRAFDGQRRFVGNASHELRTPLAINRTLIEVALGRPDASSDLRQLGHTLLEVNGRHERLIDGLLTLARSDDQLTRRGPVDLADVAAHVVDQVRTEADQAGVQIDTALAGAPTDGDSVLLERLTLNLIHNGVRHNTRDGWVSVATANGGSTVRLTVSNSGPPVAAYEIPELFEPFRRLEGRVGSARGTGLGLSIVRSVAQAHGGTVEATPRTGGGLTITVTLPR